jgi:hypothetical protein
MTHTDMEGISIDLETKDVETQRKIANCKERI